MKANNLNWQSIEASLYAISESLEINANKAQETADELYKLANQLHALNQQKNSTDAEKMAFYTLAQKLISQKFDFSVSSADASAIDVVSVPQAEKTKPEFDKYWYSAPAVPLNLPMGYQESMRWAEYNDRKLNLGEAMDAFSLALDLSANIPFIYDSVRENANRPQEFCAVLETLTQMHRTHVNFLKQDFEALQTDLLAGMQVTKASK